MNNIAKILLETKAVKLNVENPFTFASGIKSPIYCDNRKIIGFPIQRKVIVKAMQEKIATKDFDVIAGTATAGIPWASFVSYEIDKPLCYVRTKSKDHGTGIMIEGCDVKDKNVILIEDLISTGGSCIKAADILLEAGAKSVFILSIFSYGFQVAFDAFESKKIQWDSLSNFEALMELVKQEKYLSEKEIEHALLWNKNYLTWGK